MSIKTLFEDIADAIREKSGSSDAYTPSEMPSAIRSIPSGSSTARGVTYDNIASGLTANNVQGAIDELAGNVSTITSDLSELDTKVNRGSVSVIGNGVKTYGTLLNELHELADLAKISTSSVFVESDNSTVNNYFQCAGSNNGTIFFTRSVSVPTAFTVSTTWINNTGSQFIVTTGTSGSAPTTSDNSSQVCPNGISLTIQY